MNVLPPDDSENTKGIPPDTQLASTDPSLLISAAAAGDLELVKELIAAGASLDAHDNDGFSALPIAALCGHEGVVRHLSDAGASPDSIHGDLTVFVSILGQTTVDALVHIGHNRIGRVLESLTPVEWAASKGNIRLLKALLFYGAAAQSPLKEAALRLAAREGHLKIVEILIERKVSVNVDVPELKSALAEAAENGHLNIVKTLLAAGATQKHTHWPPLTFAAEKGHMDIMKLLLSADKTYINARDHESMTALDRVVQYDAVDAARTLIEAGADIYTDYDILDTLVEHGALDMTKMLLAAKANPDAYTETPLLIVASISGNAGMIQELLSANANTEIKDAKNMTAMSHAVLRRRLDVVKILAKAKADVNVATREVLMGISGYSNNNYTPLKLAAERGDAEALDIIIKAGALVNANYGQGQFALGIAAREGHLDCVKALIAAKAAIERRSYKGKTALMDAAHSGHVDILEELIAAGANVHTRDDKGRPALLFANTTGVADALLAARAEVNVRDKNGSTPLLHAIELRDIEYVKTLLKADANINDQNFSGMSPLLGLLSHPSTPVNDEIFKLLLEKRADVRAVNSDGDGALHLLASHRSVNIQNVELLLDAGACVNLQNHKGKTALMCAIKNHALSFVSLLISRRADVHLRDNQGRTALIEAGYRRAATIMSELLKYGAHINAQKLSGKTALMAAVKMDARDCVELLLEAKADVNIVDSDNATALRNTIEHGDVETLKLLVAAGAQPEIGYSVYDSPLYAALASHTSEILDVLLSAKAHIDMSKLTKHNTRPLEKIVRRGKTQIMQQLVDAGLDLSQSRNLSAYVIHTAVKNNDERMLRLLVRAGAPVDAVDLSRTNRTSLMSAVSPSILRYLLETHCHQTGYLKPLENIRDTCDAKSLLDDKKNWHAPEYNDDEHDDDDDDDDDDYQYSDEYYDY